MGIMGYEGGSGLLRVRRWICRDSQKVETEGEFQTLEI